MSDKTVLPCPFCGSNDASVTDPEDDRYRLVECGGCGAMGPWVRFDWRAEDEDAEEQSAHAEAITKWNQRAKR